MKQKKNQKYDFTEYTELNILTIIRVVLTVLAVLFIFSGNIRLLLISFVVIGLAETTNLVDVYWAKKNNHFTDITKVLDPLSDSISRFFFFFALAYNNLFPMWFLIFFFFSDIVVAYIRIYSAATGRDVSIRLSSKIKNGVQFTGQYLLLLSLILNKFYNFSNNKCVEVSHTFIISLIIIGLSLFLFVLFIFKVRGYLATLLVMFSVLLSSTLYFSTVMDYYINYLSTFIIAMIVISFTIYTLSDYIFSLRKNLGKRYRFTFTSTFILVLLLVSPFSLDLISNKWTSNINKENISIDWADQLNLNIRKNSEIEVKGLAITDGLLLLSYIDGKRKSYIDVYDFLNEDNSNNKYDDQKIKNKSEDILLLNNIAFPENYLITDMEFDGENLFVIDDGNNFIHKLNIKDRNLKILKSYETGFVSSGTLTICEFNKKRYLVINDYLVNNFLYFIDLDNIDEKIKLKNQIAFKIESEFFVKAINFVDGKLYMLVNKLLKDLIYEINLEKAIYKGNIQAGIEKIMKAPDWNIEGVSALSTNKIITYDKKSSKLRIGNMNTE